MKSRKTMWNYGLSVILMAFLAGCAPAPTKVTRIDPNRQIDLSGKWNDTDSRLVSDEMIAVCLNGPWAGEFMERNGRLPVVMVATVFNKTEEHISADTFINDLERAFIESKRARVVQGGAELDEIRAIRQGQASFAEPTTRDFLRKELGVDFVLQGQINGINDRDLNRSVRFYQVDLELTDLNTIEKVWIGQKEIKKYIEKGSYTY